MGARKRGNCARRNGSAFWRGIRSWSTSSQTLLNPAKREGLGGHASFGPPEGGDADALADAELEGAFHDLHKAREALAAEDARACHDFRVSLLGGAWLMEVKGRAYDAFQGSAIGARATAWCLEYKVARSARFDISLYGEAGSKAFAEEWCRRMQYFLICTSTRRMWFMRTPQMTKRHMWSTLTSRSWPRPSTGRG